MEQAKLGDQVACSCKGGPHHIVSAASTTFVDGIPVARVGDRSSCGASIVSGLDWYPIEGASAAIHGSQTSCGGVVIASASGYHRPAERRHKNLITPCHSAATLQPTGGIS